MKLAFFNIQNIFHRHIGLVNLYNNENKVRWTQEFENLMLRQHSSQSDYDRMRILSHFLGFDKDEQTPYYTIKNTMGQLRIKRGVDMEMPKASHLTHWEGWAKIDSIPIDDVAIHNKAKVILEVDPDVLILAEVEDRDSLLKFGQSFLSSEQTSPYKEIVFLPTNDTYGRGIGVLAKKGFNLESLQTHVNTPDCNGNPIFDVDLQKYRVKTCSGMYLDIHCTHFTNNNNDLELFAARQKLQSKHIATLFNKKQLNTTNPSVLVGTLNAPSYSNAIAPIIQDTELRDITKHLSFSVDLDKGKDADYFRLGAYKMGVNIKQRDYLMLSKGLFNATLNCGLVRKGMGHKNRPKWGIFNTIKNEKHTASQHPMLWCDLDI
ncbi:hypothetical protein [Flagellimonas sp. S3867]|uniref:hypothetical protein n=1 Tax=Flagellimonas sp. S3867 TaxID=2768063 RepID=UPI001686D5C5|nr:hypothetical protein [Flagellimonas sp. S3867]